MKKTNSNQFTPLLLLLLTITVHKAACLTTTAAAEGCNSTRIGDCLTDDEFLMESETTRRLLAGRVTPITPPSIIPTKTPCNKDVYGSCPGQPNSYYTKRPCDYQNHCGRSGIVVACSIKNIPKVDPNFSQDRLVTVSNANDLNESRKGCRRTAFDDQLLLASIASLKFKFRVKPVIRDVHNCTSSSDVCFKTFNHPPSLGMLHTRRQETSSIQDSA
ncbi:hypothetical protein BUALT_Bualt16G0023100 [Buddleja alternifolia]|uniref:Uncharacterized protein n=1 Tax=Buddleja alternifolia TaxID=168488 RepID=A0AAV6WDT9_9LAMI|nr:hypothetical protein BUALT_Bualt16G0023100 [Buddleja alternifolia]